MRKVSGLVAAAGLVVLTAGCVQDGYPSSGYGYSPGYYNTGYSGYSSGYSGGYYSQPTYYSTYSPPPQVVTQTRYVPVPVSRPMRDRDRDGIPDRYDRDKNGDGVPDRYQRRW